jgi:hypothetical protein
MILRRYLNYDSTFIIFKNGISMRILKYKQHNALADGGKVTGRWTVAIIVSCALNSP